jgi:cytochrome c5
MRFGFMFRAAMPSIALVAAIAALLAVATLPGRAQGAAPNVLPPGDGRDLVATACSQCHSPLIVTRVREGEAGWTRHVHNMITRGAQLTPAEASRAIAYLTDHFGPGSLPIGGNPSAANVRAISLPAGAGKELVETRCTLCHDLERVTVAKRQKSDWPILVANMVGRGATATADEAKTIASYLAANFGVE